jgi:hypothetical protein
MKTLDDSSGLGDKNVKASERLRRAPWPGACQLSPYRRARTVVGDDRTGTCRAMGND